MLWFFGYVRKYLKYFVLSIPFGLFVSATSGSLALILKFATDEGIEKGNFTVIVLSSVAVVLVFLLRGIGKIFSTKLVRTACEGITLNIRKDVFRKLQLVPLDKTSSSPETISKLVSDTIIISQIDEVIRSFLKDPPALLILCAIAFWLSPPLATFSLSSFLFVAVAVRYISKRIQKASARAREDADLIARKIQDVLQGTKAVRIYSDQSIIPKFDEISQSYKRNMVKSEVLRATASAVAEMSGAVIVGILLVIAGKAMTENKMTIGSFLAFIGAVAGMWEPIKFMSNSFSKLSQILPSIKRLAEFSKLETMKDGSKPKRTFESSIEFQNVSFWYSPDKKILDNLNFKIEKGQKICIVGKSGQGKTTLVSLIPRFFDVKEGAVKIDGTDVREIKLSDLRALVSFVEQEPYIFDGTVFENVAIAKPDATEREVEEALRKAEFPVDSIPLNFECGEHGKNLSVGQKHRIAIARAILKGAPILILDEPTANLDLKTEEQLLDAFRKLVKDKTVILITHRSKIANLAQKIFILENGKLRETDFSYFSQTERSFKNFESSRPSEQVK